MVKISKLLSEWIPSKAVIEFIKLNAITNEQIAKSVEYLKSQGKLNNIVDGYDNWDTFFYSLLYKSA